LAQGRDPPATSALAACGELVKIPAPRWDPTCESRDDYQQRHERYLQMLEE